MVNISRATIRCWKLPVCIRVRKIEEFLWSLITIGSIKQIWQIIISFVFFSKCIILGILRFAINVTTLDLFRESTIARMRGVIFTRTTPHFHFAITRHSSDRLPMSFTTVSLDLDSIRRKSDWKEKEFLKLYNNTSAVTTGEILFSQCSYFFNNNECHNLRFYRCLFFLYSLQAHKIFFLQIHFFLRRIGSLKLKIARGRNSETVLLLWSCG